MARRSASDATSPSRSPPRKASRPRSQEPPTGWFRENLERSLPILAGGAVCLGAAAILVHGPAHALGLRLPLWPLLGAVGFTLMGGGCALTLVEEPASLGPGSPAGDYVLVNRDVWLQVQAVAARMLEPAVPRVEPAPPVPEPWDEGAAPPRPAPALPVNAAVVASVSEQLVSEARASKAGGAPRPATAAAPRAAPVPEQAQRYEAAQGVPPGPSPATSRPVRPPSPAPSQPPQELASVLSLLGRAEASVRSRIVPSRREPVRERCIGCGISVSAYSEQLCVMCDRPLCDRCTDLTAAAGHPQMCDTCHNAFRTDAP